MLFKNKEEHNIKCIFPKTLHLNTSLLTSKKGHFSSLNKNITLSSETWLINSGHKVNFRRVQIHSSPVQQRKKMAGRGEGKCMSAELTNL